MDNGYYFILECKKNDMESSLHDLFFEKTTIVLCYSNLIILQYDVIHIYRHWYKSTIIM